MGTTAADQRVEDSHIGAGEPPALSAKYVRYDYILRDHSCATYRVAKAMYTM
jgi:hypothetical protein